MMAKFHQQIFVILAIFIAFGYCKKCTFGDVELEVTDDMDCSAFTPVKRPHNVHSVLSADKVNVGVEKISSENVRALFWDGFPFPPDSGFPPRFPGIGWPSHWFGGSRRRRPRPRPPASDIEECPDEGVKFISHPTDCELYILCVDGEEVAELRCPAGLHFSRELRSCTHPMQAECEDFEFQCDPDDPSVSFLPDVTNCNAYFICIGGNQVPMTCAANQHWSFLLNQCTDPDTAMCPWEDMEEPTAINRPLTSHQMLPPNFIPPINGNGNGNGLQPASRCPATGVVNIPVPGNCEEFIVCFNGREFPQTCPNNLHFCQDLLICVNPDIANCGVGCPSTGIAFLPHEDDCNLYYVCFGGTPHLMRCPGDTHFSVETNQCMDPLEAGCKDFDNIECPATGIEQIPYPYDCERYILCVNGVEIPLQCAPGLHFSPTLRICTVPEIAQCEERLRGCPEVDDPLNIVFLPNEEDCNRYYLCWGGNQIPMSCPSGLHWSTRENACMDPDDANCEFAAFECPEEGVEQFPHPDSCEKFILCANGAELLRTCPNNMHFSPYTRTCMHPDLAGCGGWECPENSNQIVFIPNPEDCTSYYVCFGDQQIPMRCGSNLHWSILDQACMPPGDANCPFLGEDNEEPKVEEDCPSTGILAIPHSTSCKDYILCINGAEVERECPQGTEFNRETRTCTHPIVANCQSRFMPASFTAASSGICPTITSIEDIVFRENPDDCGSYYLCLQNEMKPMRCGDGLNWSATKHKCMTKDQAHCKA